MTHLKLPAQSPVPARGSGNASPKDHGAQLVGQGTQQGVLGGQGSFEGEAMSELSSKEQGDCSSWWVVPHTSTTHNGSPEMWSHGGESVPSGPEDQSPGRPASSPLEGCGDSQPLCYFSPSCLGFGVNTQWWLKRWL